jgi:hypothetical protein
LTRAYGRREGLRGLRDPGLLCHFFLCQINDALWLSEIGVQHFLVQFLFPPADNNCCDSVSDEVGERPAFTHESVNAEEDSQRRFVRRIGQTRRYQSTPSGLKTMVAIVVLRNKAIKPLLAAAQNLRPSRGAQNPRPLDKHYDTIRKAMQEVFQELGLAA